MFAYLKGILTSKIPGEINIDCYGVGYLVNLSLNSYKELPELGQETKIYIYPTFSEMEGIKLYGFMSIEEKNLFNSLKKISKIGAKLALAILSKFNSNELIKVIVEKNEVLLSQVPGIGKKSAQRLIVELKDKLENYSNNDKDAFVSDNLLIDETISALKVLGFKEEEISKIIRNMDLKKYTQSEELIKECIKLLYKK